MPSKVLRHNIHGITKPAIQRLAFLGGCKRLSGLIYEETRGILKTFLENLLFEVVTETEHARRKTCSLEDLKQVITRRGQKLYGNEDNYPICKTFEEIRKHNGVCVVIAKLPFTRVVREISQDFKTDLHFTKSFLENIQYYTEKYLIGLFHMANDLAINIGKKVGITVTDLQYVKKYNCKTTDSFTMPPKPPKTGKKKTAAKKVTKKVAKKDAPVEEEEEEEDYEDEGDVEDEEEDEEDSPSSSPAKKSPVKKSPAKTKPGKAKNIKAKAGKVKKSPGKAKKAKPGKKAKK